MRMSSDREGSCIILRMWRTYMSGCINTVRNIGCLRRLRMWMRILVCRLCYMRRRRERKYQGRTDRNGGLCGEGLRIPWKRECERSLRPENHRIYRHTFSLQSSKYQHAPYDTILRSYCLYII